MARYGKKTQETLKDIMERFKKGELKSGNTGKKLKSKKPAIAIGLSEARDTWSGRFTSVSRVKE
jgi:Family of unknown function (DUF6496)